jgi:hypothetical protein
MRAQPLILVVTLDVECDKGPKWEVRRPIQFSSVHIGIAERLMPLFRQFGVVPTFLLSPEVISNEEAAEALAKVQPCELGTHLHGEFVPPDDHPDTPWTFMPQFLYRPEVEREKLANLTQLFESRFGYRPRSFRAGRFGLSRHTLRFLADLGYLVDSSVTPFWVHDFGEWGKCNYWGAPIQPYFPDWEEPYRPGSALVLEVPVTIVHPRLVCWPRWLLRRLNNRPQWYKKLLHIIPNSRPNRPLWLRPWRSTPEEMILIADAVARLTPPNRPVVLNMMYHSMEVIPGASPYPQTEEDVQNFLKCQEVFFDYINVHYDVQSVGLGELYTFFSQEAWGQKIEK